MTRIKCVSCPEPPREGEYGWSAVVGFTFNNLRQGKVTQIIERQENLGTYGIIWYDVFTKAEEPDAKETLVASFNAAQVTVVTYFTEGKDY